MSGGPTRPEPGADPHLAAAPTDRPEDRHVSAYSTAEKVRRMLWAVAQATLYRCSFHTWNRWRVFLLNAFGARVHPTCVIRRTSRVECPWNLTMGRNSCLGDNSLAYCLGPVTIGDRVSISQNVHLCAGSHDYNAPNLPLTRPPIRLENDAWIAADAFVGPGVTVGEGAILGARGCAFRDLEPWTIYGGNPARPIKARPRLGGSAAGTAPESDARMRV